ncbi:stalk domain-containing protein [Brevibacillus borstelensis]|uniref:stalk domain-containing protein n=1 Tax=Brevibacillus borstelensis TaxID=45462 RepID=UPI00203DCBAF|nr:stalk domain-containing protein [Brevibacillus borstelensis]MCM3559691.1 stalk domain-containing protein [Brevibacillus borstelensis]MCM3591074.1 stalk domain-containing protein [Brevibacillus borstelensis]
MRGKRAIACLIGLQLLMAVPVGAAGNASGNAAASPASNTQISVNGQALQLKQPAIIIDGRTYLAIEDMAGILQAKWQASNNQKEVAVTLPDGKTISFQINTKRVAVDNKWSEIDQGAILHNKQMYVPLRWMTEKSGYELKWNPQTRTVEIVAPVGNEEFKQVDFTSLSEDEKAFVQQVKGTQGVHQKGDLYVIARGQAPNPGYGIEIVNTEMSWEQLKVYVKLTKPEPGRMYAQVISYPFIVVKVKLPPYTTLLVLDANTKKPLFEGAQGM